MIRSRWSLLCTLALFIAMVPRDASGGGRAAPPRVSALPSGAPPAMQVSAPPERIPPVERAEGLYPIRPYGGRGAATRDQPQYAMVVGSEEAARSFSTGRGFNAEADQRTCLLSAMNLGRGSMGLKEVQWHPSFHNTTTVSASAPSGGVQAVRAERFSAFPEGRGELTVAHAWVDAVTLGARLISRGTVPFARVATGPGGVEIYAARNGDAVEVVVTTATPQAVRARLGGMAFQGSGGIAGSQSGCGHIRFSLRAGRGAADMVTVQGDVSIGPAAPRPRRSLLESALGSEPSSEQRARPLRIGISTSWTSRDPEPVLSIAMGWAGRERVF